MTFTVHVEHELIDGKMVLEEFEGVESLNDPPMTGSTHLSFADGEKDDKQLNYGTIVRAVDETTDD